MNTCECEGCKEERENECNCQFNDDCLKSEQECLERIAYLSLSEYITFH